MSIHSCLLTSQQKADIHLLCGWDTGGQIKGGETYVTLKLLGDDEESLGVTLVLGLEDAFALSSDLLEAAEYMTAKEEEIMNWEDEDSADA